MPDNSVSRDSFFFGCVEAKFEFCFSFRAMKTPKKGKYWKIHRRIASSTSLLPIPTPWPNDSLDPSPMLRVQTQVVPPTSAAAARALLTTTTMAAMTGMHFSPNSTPSFSSTTPTA